jgi:alkylhydroperoxidase family enzyme
MQSAASKDLDMQVIPYVDALVSEPADIVRAIRARRGGTLLNLDRMLLHSPAFAAGWNHHLGIVRTRLLLDPRLREMVVCAIGHLNGAAYEVHQHAGPFLDAGGTREQLAALSDPDLAVRDDARFTDAERLALRLTIAITRGNTAPADLLSETRGALGSDQLVVELVGLIATYNMVSRFITALDIRPEEPEITPRPGDPVSVS